MAASLTHRLEPGWTYTLTVEPRKRVRLDWSEPTTLMLWVLDADIAMPFPTRHGWVRVLDTEIVVERQCTLSLRVEDALGNTQQWVSAAVRDLARSSKEQLPQSVWAAYRRETVIEDTAGTAGDIFRSDYLHDLRQDWPD